MITSGDTTVKYLIIVRFGLGNVVYPDFCVLLIDPLDSKPSTEQTRSIRERVKCSIKAQSGLVCPLSRLPQHVRIRLLQHYTFTTLNCPSCHRLQNSHKQLKSTFDLPNCCQNTDISRFITSQLQLEADAREALPYVRSVIEHNFHCSTNITSNSTLAQSLSVL